MKKYIIGSVHKDKKLTTCSLDSSSISFGKNQCYFVDLFKKFCGKGLKESKIQRGLF